jgi:peroxiredoxin
VNPRANRFLLLLTALAAAACGTEPAPAPAPTNAVDAAADVPAPAAATPVAPAAPATPATPAVPKTVEHPAPDFTLTDPDGASHSLADYRGKWVVLEWTNHGCPFVKKHYDSKNMQTLQARYTQKGVAWLTICSSAPGKEGYETPAAWKATLAAKGSAPTAMLIDADGKVGRAYGAKNTPTMFVISPDGGVVYHGAIDDKRSAKIADVAVAKNYVAETLDAVMDGRPAPLAETAAYG